MSTTSRKYAVSHSASRTLAALVGAVPAALAVGAALSLALPIPAAERYLVGYHAVFPTWATLGILTFLASSGKRAWRGLALLTVLAAAVIVVALALGRALTGEQ